MTQYFVTAWCDRSFYAYCEVETNTAEEALEKTRESIDDAPADACNDGYCWDRWQVDTAETEGVLRHLDEGAALHAAARRLLTALKGLAATARTFRNVPEEQKTWTSIDDDALEEAFAAISQAEGRTA